MALTDKQRGVLKGMTIGAATSLVVIITAILFGPALLSPDAPAGERLAIALQADVFLALWLGVSIGLLARHRFFTPEDIDGGGLTRGSETAMSCKQHFKTPWNKRCWQCWCTWHGPP